MADLHLEITGDSHGAQEALHDTAAAGGHAHDSLHELKEKTKELSEEFALGTLAAKAFEGVIESLKEGLKESWEEAAKAENADRQLALAAGDLTKEFKEQAEALGQNLARKSEDIEAMQTLLLRYGAAPEAIGGMITAAHNLAVGLNEDATTALNQMIRAVESGTGHIGRMGPQFKVTGDKAQDFANAVAAVNAKFGDAAETEAGGMNGRLRAASNALDEVKKSFGALVGAMEEKLGVLSSVAAYFNQVAQGGGAMGGTLAGALAIFNKATGYTPKTAVPTVEGNNPMTGGGVDVDIGDISLSPTAKALAQGQRSEDKYEDALQKQSDFIHKMAKNWDDFDLEQDKKEHETLVKKLEEMDKLDQEEAKGFMKLENEHAKDLEGLGDMQFKMMKAQTDAQAQELERRKSMWTQLGTQIGIALIDGIFAAMSNKNGAAENSWDTARKVTQSIFLTAVQIISSAFGMGYIGSIASNMFQAADQSNINTSTGDMFMQSFTGISGAAASHMGGSGGYSDQQMANSGYYKSAPPSQHSGGWVKYHGGGWAGEVPSMLLRGERVLSREEVTNFGGREAVDAAARGGSRGATIYAFDSESMLDMFSRKAGRSMFNVVRTGKGPLRSLFGIT
jgi:hypothetical protein